MTNSTERPHPDPILETLLSRLDAFGIRPSDSQDESSFLIHSQDGEHALSFSGNQAQREAVRACLDDIVRARSADDHLALFTREIDEAYEALSLLYRLTEEIADTSKPEAFIDKALLDLKNTGGFRWTALALLGAADAVPSLRGRTWIATDHDDESLSLRHRIESAGSEFSAITHAQIVQTELGAPLDEVVVAPVHIEGLRAGFLISSGQRRETHLGRIELTSADTQANLAVSRLLDAALHSYLLHQRQHATVGGTLAALTSSLEAKDPYTRGHSERVAMLAAQFAVFIGHPRPDRIELAGRLHDIGKIGIPDRVLCKPARLTDEEFEIIKTHPVVGFEILKAIPSLEDVLPAVLHHHERWDGRGYPHGIGGAELDLPSRILAIADTFDAMSSNRAYRSGRTRAEVLDEILRCSGAQFDPDLTEQFVKMDFSEFDALKREHELSDLGTQRIDEAA